MGQRDKSTSREELWEFYMGKYKNPNPIAQRLTQNFFNCIENRLQTLPVDHRLLEVGCGPGESTRKILGFLQGQYFEASEFEQDLVDLHLENNFPVPLSQETAYDMHRRDNEFSCVLLLEVLEHLEDYDTALTEIFRVAAEDVIISVPNEPLWRVLNFARGKYWRDWGNTPGHLNHWSKKQFIKLIQQHGDVISVQNPLPWTIIHARVKH